MSVVAGIQFLGPTFTVSELAMAEPTAQPRTGDMVEMVENLRRLGQIRKKPCAFTTSAGIIVHPDLYDHMRKLMSTRINDFTDQAFLRALR